MGAATTCITPCSKACAGSLCDAVTGKCTSCAAATTYGDKCDKKCTDTGH